MLDTHIKRFLHQAIIAAVLCISPVITQQVHAAKELSFCPGGGPTGWLNHFNFKRDQKKLRRFHRQYPNSPYPYQMKLPHPRYHPYYARYFHSRRHHGTPLNYRPSPYRQQPYRPAS